MRRTFCLLAILNLFHQRPDTLITAMAFKTRTMLEADALGPDNTALVATMVPRQGLNTPSPQC